MTGLVFVFPGQGAQYVGMGKSLYEHSGRVRELFQQAGQALGLDLTGLCFEGPAEQLQKTEYAQPAILTVSIACLEVLSERGLHPVKAAGHSLGEYSALVAAGSLTFLDAVRLVRQRGRFMQEAVPPGVGGMVAVLGLGRPEVVDICNRAGEAGIVEAANLNCPGQVVIAGEKNALDRAAQLAREAGAKRCVPLAVSAPFHSSLMKAAGERLAAELAGVQVLDPAIGVVANVSADYLQSAAEVKAGLIGQVSSPVRWEESIRRILADGNSVFVEVGPGKVLTGLIKKIDRSALTFNVEDWESLEKVVAELGKDD
ncbi:MAG: ACP S-malonyltransferase [Bacillota bacterium]|jgi:[acyl-carrier-protein] S-malonyltransferase